MTATLADFIASDEGEMYGTYCAHYGKDPGAIFADEVLGFQVGVAYMIQQANAKRSPSAEPMDYWEGQLR